jgi:hypothetical protein
MRTLAHPFMLIILYTSAYYCQLNNLLKILICQYYN